MSPRFSIVTPVFDRQDLVGRVIESTLAQSYRDFEHILVDDGSTDGSASRVAAYRDPRVRLLRHTRNRGVSPARNTGVAAARGDWVIFLDSDDELLPGALGIIAGRVAVAPPDVDRLAFMYQLSTGGLSPQPPLVNEVWDYAGYLRWASTLTGPSDFSNCIRRRTFAQLRFSEDRAFEGLYHLEFATRFRTQACPEVVARVHADAGNRTSRPTVRSLLSAAGDNARAGRTLLRRHGDALQELSPSRYAAELRSTAAQCFLSGDRVGGWRHALRLLRWQPSASGLSLLLAGLLGRRLLASAMVSRIARRQP